MKKALSSLLLSLLVCVSYGQINHLEPVRNFAEYEGVLKEYYDNVFPLLYKGFAEKPTARYTSMPSFSEEYAFSLEREDDKYFIVSNTLSTNYWYAKKRGNVKVNIGKKKISVNLYNQISDLFKLLAEQTKKKPDDGLIGCDGVTYYFATTDSEDNIRIGETWSPYDGTLLARLVNICDNLYSLGNGKNISQDGMMGQIKNLMDDLVSAN